MAKSKALGRGLGNLIPVNENQEPIDPNKNSSLREIRITDVLPNPNQPRKSFSEANLEELANTIKTHGIIQPIVVRETDKGYVLISGERRLRACKKAGFHKIPAIVKKVSERDSLEMAILENIQREDLNPIEEALAYKKLSEEYGLKTTEIAQKLGKNRSTIANLIRLLNFPEKIQNYLKERKITEGQARPVLSIPDERKQIEIIEKIIQDGMTARQVEDYVSQLLEDQKSIYTKSKEKKKDPEILKLESKLRNKLSTKVDIQHNTQTGKGKIAIYYNNLDQLEELLKNF